MAEEPKIKWKDSKAKSLLHDDILNGIVPLKATDADNRSTGKLLDIYNMHPEYAEYSYKKFSSRLSSIRKTISVNKSRAEDDRIALAKYIHNHAVSTVSHHGYTEWQNSTAQTLVLGDIESHLHDSMGIRGLYEFRPEYHEEFPLSVFRDKVKQEMQTAKYLHTLNVKGKLHKSS
jgi:hypothetical protein